MCPLRFILVFFSAVLAGYFAWRTVRSAPDADADLSLQEPLADADLKNETREVNLKKAVQDGFWVFVDMASGKYLWRNFKEMRAQEGTAAKSC